MMNNEEIMNKLTELLKVIDFEICELNNDSITIKDQLCPVEYIDKIQLPVQDYRTYDDLRIFTSTKIENNDNYYFRVLNAKYPEKKFTKNGIGFDISMLKTKNDEENSENFNLNLSYNGCYYSIFMGKNKNEKYMCCRTKEKEWLDFYYVVRNQNQKEINVSFNGLSHQLIAKNDKKNSSIVVQEKINSNIEKYLIDDNDINNYFNAIAFELKDIVLRIIEVISRVNNNFLNIIYTDYPIMKEFIDMANSEVTEELIDNLFEKYSNNNFCIKDEKMAKRLIKH